MVGQVNGEYETRDQRITKYVNLVTLRLGKFLAWRLKHVSRDSNGKAYALVAVATSLLIKETILLLIYYQPESSITTKRVNEIDEARPSWMIPIVCYLSSGKMSDNKADTQQIQVQAARFSLTNDEQYKWSLAGPFLKCLTHYQGQYGLAKLHNGVCGNQPDSRTLAHRSHTQCYY